MSTIVNGVMMQFFQWYLPVDGKHWGNLQAKAGELRDAGFTAVWLPPMYKGSGGTDDVGYGVYDLFDLGEFKHKPHVTEARTKYGTRQQLLDGIKAAKTAGLQVYADVVFNHKNGGDETELVMAQQVKWDHRNDPIGDEQQIKVWTRFTFPGRNGKYSSMVWDWHCFDALSFDENRAGDKNKRLFRLKNKRFETEVSHEHQNYDYLMANDLDMGYDPVEDELKRWGEWFYDTTKVDGFRIDAVKHIRSSYFPGWLGHMRWKFGRPFFSVGEYWSEAVDKLHAYLAATAGTMSLFDVALHYRFYHASRSGNGYNMAAILDHTLMKDQPSLAVTFVDNHDTQPCESLESWVEPWFKPIAYAIILLRREGYPCVFYGDYYEGQSYTGKWRNTDIDRQVTVYSHRFLIDRFLDARRRYGYGDQHDYFDHPNTIGWVRTGDNAHPGVMAVVLTNGAPGNKWMNTFRPNTRFYDVTGHHGHEITTNRDGWGNFPCPGGSVSVWLTR